MVTFFLSPFLFGMRPGELSLELVLCYSMLDYGVN